MRRWVKAVIRNSCQQSAINFLNVIPRRSGASLKCQNDEESQLVFDYDLFRAMIPAETH